MHHTRRWLAPFFFLSTLIAAQMPAHVQFEDIGKKLQRKLEQKVEQRVDRKTD